MPLRSRLPALGLLLVLGLPPAATPVFAGLARPFTPVAPAEPVIPAARLSLADFGGVPDGKTLNTDAFERALSTLAEKGGGTLVVPPGIWHTGPVRLRSHLRLQVEAGAVIRFSRDYRLYPLRVFDARGEKSVDSTSPISGEKLEDVAITGAGVIDGGGDGWRLVKRAKLPPGDWDALVKSGGVLSPKGDEWWPSQAALNGRDTASKITSLDPADHEAVHHFLRPKLLRLLDCRRVLLEGVTFRNAPNWTLHPWLCEDLTLRDLKILNPHYAQNSDAMDIDSCRRVVVRGCLIDTGDDGICIKSGMNESGRRLGVPTEDVLVEDCTVLESHGGFTIGSEMSGGVRNVLARNLTFIGTDIGLRFKTTRERGGVVENIHLSGIRMTGIAGNAIDFNFFYASKGGPGATVPPVTEATPQFRNMLFENIVSLESEGSLTLRGLPEMPLRDITFRDVSLSAGHGADLAYAEGIVFERVRIHPASGEALQSTEVKNSRLELTP